MTRSFYAGKTAKKRGSLRQVIVTGGGIIDEPRRRASSTVNTSLARQNCPTIRSMLKFLVRFTSYPGYANRSAASNRSLGHGDAFDHRRSRAGPTIGRDAG